MADAVESFKNPRLKRARLLIESRRARQREGLFCVEGEDLVAVALARGIAPVEVLVREDAAPPPGTEHVAVEVRGHALDAVGTLGHGARAIATFRSADLPRAPASPSLALWLDGVHDPGNVGTLLRSALAFGADLVALGPDCADPTGRRRRAPRWARFFAVAAPAVPDPRAAWPGARLVALAGEATQALADVRLDGPVVILLGGERDGLSDAARAAADVVCRIPQAGPVGSLNVAMAGTVALYELARHRAPAP